MSVDVAFYLSHLLYRNNIAILPGFGAFVSTPTSAIIDHARGTFAPPSKLLTFNENLKINDGYLINLIRNKHGYTAHESRAIVENFVQSINDILKNKDTVRLDKIGKLYLNHNSQVIFEPEQKSNFNVASFGLPSVQYYALPKLRQEDNVQVNEEVKVKEEVKTVKESVPTVEPVFSPEPTPIVKELNPTWWDRNKFASAAIIFGLIATTAIWYFNKKREANNDQSNLSVPVSEIRVNVKPGAEQDGVNNISNGEVIDNQNNTTADNSKSTTEPPLNNVPDVEIKESPRSKSNNNELTAAPILPDNISDANLTIFIVGTYSKQANIRRTSKTIKSKGFELYNVPFNGLRRVGAVIRFNSEIDKNNQIDRLRAEFGDGIWELEK